MDGNYCNYDSLGYQPYQTQPYNFNQENETPKWNPSCMYGSCERLDWNRSVPQTSYPNYNYYPPMHETSCFPELEYQNYGKFG